MPYFTLFYHPFRLVLHGRVYGEIGSPNPPSPPLPPLQMPHPIIRLPFCPIFAPAGIGSVFQILMRLVELFQLLDLPSRERVIHHADSICQRIQFS